MKVEIFTDKYGTTISTDIEGRPGSIDLYESEGDIADQIKDVAKCCIKWLKDNGKLDLDLERVFELK